MGRDAPDSPAASFGAPTCALISTPYCLSRSPPTIFLTNRYLRLTWQAVLRQSLIRAKQTLPAFPTTCAQSYPLPRTLPAILTNGRGASNPPSKPPWTKQTPAPPPAKPTSGPTAKTPRNPPAPAPPPAKPFPAGTRSPTVSLPKPTSPRRRSRRAKPPPPGPL